MTARKVVVGYDGSAGARAATVWALDEAARTDAPLELFYAYQWPVSTPAASLVPGTGVWPDTETERRVSAMLEDARAEAAASHPAVRVTTAIVPGAAAPLLRDRSRHATLLVLGSHGHGAWSGLLLGSVSTAVTAHAHCPVVVVRGTAPTLTDDPRPIVVGLDGSACAQIALGFAFEQAAARAVALTVVRCWLPPGPPWTDLEVDVAATTAAETAAVNDLLAGWQEKYPEVPVGVRVAAEHPVHALLTAAVEAQLLVVGSRGRGGLAGLLLGSVSQLLVQRADCPVAVVRERAVA
jgi:nucleotide-binding universal stress UspA family protein